MPLLGMGGKRILWVEGRSTEGIVGGNTSIDGGGMWFVGVL